MLKVNGGNLLKLNSKMSKILATVAMHMGIKKTQSGKPLNFYPVTKSELNYLTAETSKSMIPLRHGIEWRPLITVDADMMTEAIYAVNQKYSERMDQATHKKYQSELIEAMVPCVTKLNEDKIIERKAPKRDRSFYGI
jgi:hypothetical protein